MPTPVNQESIAKKLGLSIATVSRSLANHPAISAETRTAVAEAARSLGYRRHARRAGTESPPEKAIALGVLVGLQPNSSPLATFPSILKGIQERAKSEHAIIEVNYVDPNRFNPADDTDPVMQQIRAGRWRGLVLVYPFSPDIVRALATRIPVVATLEDYDNARVDSIDTNHHTGIMTVVNRLATLGHRRIGFLTWTYPTSGHWVAQRFGAYVAGLFARGLEFQAHWVLNVHRSAPSRTADQLADEVTRLIRQEGVTAWVCAADHQAYQLMLALNTRGLRVPEDCSLTGFDGIEPPLSLKPVTSLRVPNETIGAAALVRLLNRIQHPKAHQRKILVETQFIEGTTIAAPPAA